MENEKTIQQVLEFARETAKTEMESIDRLHKRTLVALTIPLTAFGLLFSVVGWIGYSNLKRVAINTTTEVVRQRLDDQLTKENIDISVQRALQEHAVTQIKDAVADQVSKQRPELQSITHEMIAQTVKDLRPQIEASARTQTQALIEGAFKPRALDRQQTSSLITCLKSSAKIRLNVAVGGDPEAQSYERQLADALQESGWQISEQALLGFHPKLPRYGLVIVPSPELNNSNAANGLQQCLSKVGIDASLYAEMDRNNELSGQTSLVVLPKQR